MDLQGNILELIADDTVSVSNIYDASVAYLQTAPLNADTRAAAQLFSDTIATARTKPDVANALYTFSTTINQRTGKLLAPTVAETVVMPVQQTVVQSISVLGFYGPSMVQDGSFMVYFTEPTQGTAIGPGWTISGLTGISGNVTVVQYTSNVYGDVVINAGPPAISFPYVSNAVVVSDMPNNIRAPSSIMRLTLNQMSANYVPNVFSNATTSFGLTSYDMSAYNTSNIKGIFTELRELNSNVATSEGLNELKTIVERGAGTGALLSMAAVGAQEKYLFGGQSMWLPKFKQYTSFSMTQRLSVPLRLTGQTFLGSVTQVDLFPRQMGDLISNMYLQCTLPALPNGYSYSELVGRALFNKIEFLVDGLPYETITDDWYVIRDQLFLDADERNAMYKAVSGGYAEGTNVPAATPVNLIIPLEFFFCRRHTHSDSVKERLEKPFFPMCAVSRSTISVRFTFNTAAWITNAPTNVSNGLIDVLSPRLLVEEIKLTPEERLYYQNTKLQFKVPRVWSEAVQPYQNGLTRLNLTANYPVTMMVWFVRNQLYETQASNFYDSRYAYGYTTKYIQAATPVTFFNGANVRYIDTIEYATLYLNNQNVLSNFPGGLYYSYKQPLDHGLTVPSKNLYMYCFGKSPAEYTQEGAIDFRTLNSQTTHLDIKFLDTYTPQIASQYLLHLYYYGYVTLEVSGGYATLLS
jgi:hypothetical protein